MIPYMLGIVTGVLLMVVGCKVVRYVSKMVHSTDYI